jgi:serine/threonine-protein kinase
MDFGIARSLAGAGTTAEGTTIGTPEYMSPEQVEGKPADERADIYAIGVILFEMVTGRPPFEGDTSLAIAHKHRYNPAPDPRTLNPQIFQDLSRLILRCLEKEREARYQTTEELLTDLKAVEASLPKGERVPGRMPSGIKFKTSREITVKLTPRKLLIPALVFLALFAIIIGLLKFIPKKETSLPPASKPSVAVLAFADLSPDKSNEYLADGISDALINALSKIRNLRVPGRTSTFSFKGQKTDVREIGQKLNVKMVLEGSVQVVGDRLRVAAQLINAEDGFQLWSDRYERKMEDIFAIQDEIGRAIVDTMKIEILGDKSTASSKSSTLNLEAYSLYLKGLYLWNKRGKEDLEKSIDFFQAAIDRDRSYALAYSGLADAYSTLGGNYFMPSREAFSKSKVAAFKAIELDGTLAEAHSSLANALFHERDFSRAEREHRLAIQLKPGYATAHHWYAFVLSCSGRHKEAIDEILLARELDPLSPRINANVGHMLCFARKYDQALEELKKGIVLFPEHASNYALMGLALSQLGRFEEAIESYRRSNELSGKEGYSSIGSLEHCYAVSGHENEARNGLAQILDYSKHHFVSPVFIASIFVGLGDKDKALAWLEEGFSQSDAQLVYLKVNPIFDPLRSDPRFAAFLKKAHLR